MTDWDSINKNIHHQLGVPLQRRGRPGHQLSFPLSANKIAKILKEHGIPTNRKIDTKHDLIYILDKLILKMVSDR